ncbi:MAG: ATP-dependent DNA helicase [Candidatus ainarchaeum sp.]|nr:ATP-dependent DNA helicase [Candidatus ainarchaeum sp.]
MKIFFPHEIVRKEQEQLMNDFAKAIINRKVLLVNAPTGLGKTVSSLAPAISYAIQNNKKIFFLTPKISQHEIALETIKQINQKFGLGVKAVDLIGKKGLCLDPFLSNVNYGFYDACAKKKKEGKCKYYNNTKGKSPKQRAINNKRKAFLLKKFNLSHAETKKECFVKDLCPYELTLEKCREADVIIADYSHLFDERIRETILSMSKTKLEEIILIVDEAHNLSERIRDMFTIMLSLDVIQLAQREAKSVGKFEVEMAIKEIGEEIVSLGKNLSLTRFDSIVNDNDLEKIYKLAKNNFEIIEEAGLLFMARRRIENCALLKVLTFIEIFLQKNNHKLQIIERKNSLNLIIMPLDVSDFSGKVFNEIHSSILMSGTLLPLQMFVDVLGIKNAVKKEYLSPFPKENRLNIFVEKTTTKYTERNDAQYNEIAKNINEIIPKIPGNSIIFFPSFEILEKIFPKINTSRKILKQEREQNNEQKSNLIHNFRFLGSGFGGVLLAVSGGSIAEGIDFPGEHLYCAIIVGVPFAKVSLQTKALIDFFEKKFKKGWDYAYNAPAINKAVQAAGRVIRSETDKGVCVFLDKRFSDKRFEQFFPKNFQAKKSLEPKKEIEKFFK